MHQRKIDAYDISDEEKLAGCTAKQMQIESVTVLFKKTFQLGKY